jgi:hypothetical protein
VPELHSSPGTTPLTEPLTQEEPKLRKLLLFSLVTVILLLAMIELGWRGVCLLGFKIPPSGDRSLDKEWEWVTTYRAKGTHPITEGPFRYDPVLGWGLLPKYSKDNLHINSHGQRGLIDWSLEKHNRKRILCLGDSYTYGYDVGDTENYSAVADEILGASYEVINGGVPGYGTDQQALLYETQGVKFSPDIVVLGFYTPDLFRNQLTFFSYRKPCFELTGETLHLAQSHIPSPTELLQIYSSGEKRIGPSGLYLWAFLKRELEDLRRDKVNQDTLEWPVTAKIIEHFATAVKANHAIPLLMIIPDKEVLKKETSASHDIAGLLEGLCLDKEIPCLNLIPILCGKQKQLSEPLYKGHWTPHGHRVAAEALVTMMKTQGMIE